MYKRQVYSIGLIVYIVLIIAFAYFYTNITFNPLEIANKDVYKRQLQAWYSRKADSRLLITLALKSYLLSALWVDLPAVSYTHLNFTLRTSAV